MAMADVQSMTPGCDRIHLMDIAFLHVPIAGFQLAALGLQSPAFYVVLRRVMPVLAGLATYGAVQQGAPVQWIVAFLATALFFAGLSDKIGSRLVWVPINLSVATLNVVYLGYLGWVAVVW